MTAFAIGVDVLLVSALVAVLANVGRLFGPRPQHQGDAEVPYETGMRPFESAQTHMAVLYFRFAVLFVVFDVDLAFLLPWAFARHALTGTQMASITVFTALIGLMLAYFWKKGVLECR